MPGDMEQELKSVVDEIEDLPTLPPVVTRVMSLVDDPETTAEQIGTLLVQDPSLTGKILKIVNSPFYGFSRRISSVTNAVVFLGLTSVKNLVLSTAVLEVFKGESSPRFDLIGLWKHSIATGISAGLASEEIEDINSEEVMAGGILHAVGKIVLDQYCSDSVTRVLNYVRDHQCTMLVAEQEVLGVDHTHIGCWLARSWNLPDNLIHAIRHYPNPMEAPGEHRRFTALVHVGDILARTQNIGWTGCRETPTFQGEIWEELDLNQRDIKDILSRLQNRMKDAEIFLDLTVQKAS